MAGRTAAFVAAALLAAWPGSAWAQGKASPADALAQKFSQPNRLGGPDDGPDGPSNDDGAPPLTSRGDERRASSAKREADQARRDAERLRAEEREMLSRANAELRDRQAEAQRARAEAGRAERQRNEAEARAIEAARRQEQSRAAQAREQAREAEERKTIAEREARDAEERRRVEEAKAEAARLAAEEAGKREEARRADAERRLAELEAKAADAEERAREAGSRFTDRDEGGPAGEVVTEHRPSVGRAANDGEAAVLGPGEAFDPARPNRAAPPRDEPPRDEPDTTLPHAQVDSAAADDDFDDDDFGRDDDAPPKLYGEDAPRHYGEGRVAVLLIMDVRRTGIRRFGRKSADPMVCVGPDCYISRGAASPAMRMSRRRGFGPGVALSVRGGACRGAFRCVFREVELTGTESPLQPIDLRLFRHDRRAVSLVSPDRSCRLRMGRLICARAVTSGDYRAWIVPEELADRVGPDLLQAAVEAGLPEPDNAAGY